MCKPASQDPALLRGIELDRYVLLPVLRCLLDCVWLQMRSIWLALLQLCQLQISLAALCFKGAALTYSGMLAKMMLPKKEQQAKAKGKCQNLID